MMIDVGAYGAVTTPLTAFNSVASAASGFASDGASSIYKTASNLGTNFRKINPMVIADAKKQWNNLARDMQRMGGTIATKGAGFVQEQAMMAGREAAQGAKDEMKPYLYAGAAIAGAAVLYLVFRK